MTTSMDRTIQFMMLRRQGLTTNQIYDASTRAAFNAADQRTNARAAEFEERIRRAEEILQNLSTSISENNQALFQSEQARLDAVRVNTISQDTAVKKATGTVDDVQQALEEQRNKIKLLEESLERQLKALQNPPISRDAKKAAAFFQVACQSRSNANNS